MNRLARMQTSELRSSCMHMKGTAHDTLHMTGTRMQVVSWHRTVATGTLVVCCHHQMQSAHVVGPACSGQAASPEDCTTESGSRVIVEGTIGDHSCIAASLEKRSALLSNVVTKAQLRES